MYLCDGKTATHKGYDFFILHMFCIDSSRSLYHFTPLSKKTRKSYHLLMSNVKAPFESASPGFKTSVANKALVTLDMIATVNSNIVYSCL